MNPATLYLAVGDFFGDRNPTARLGVFRHVVGRDGWDNVLPGIPVYTVEVDPRKSSRVLAGTRDGVYLSTDAGQTFQRADCTGAARAIWSLMPDPHQPSRWYAGGSPAAIYRSDDDGHSWALLAEPTIPDRAPMPFAPRVMRMTAHPNKPGWIHAALEIAGVLRSIDGGHSWSDCSDPLIAMSEQQAELQSKIVCDMAAEGMLDGHAVCASSAHPDSVLLACRMGVFRSDDGGAHWTNLHLERFSPFHYARDILVSPHDPATLYACLSIASTSKNGALMRSTDFGASWERFDRVQPHGTLMAVRQHRSDPKQVYIAARYGEVFGTLDGGQSWQDLHVTDTQHIYGMACA